MSLAIPPTPRDKLLSIPRYTDHLDNNLSLAFRDRNVTGMLTYFQPDSQSPMRYVNAHTTTPKPRPSHPTNKFFVAL